MNALAVIAHTDQQVERRWRQQFIADLPDAADFAAELPGPIALMLANAYWDQAAPGFRARSRTDAVNLRRWGLCDYPASGNPGLLLTNFGTAVRRHVLD